MQGESFKGFSTDKQISRSPAPVCHSPNQGVPLYLGKGSVVYTLERVNKVSELGETRHSDGTVLKLRKQVNVSIMNAEILGPSLPFCHRPRPSQTHLSLEQLPNRIFLLLLLPTHKSYLQGS